MKGIIEEIIEYGMVHAIDRRRDELLLNDNAYIEICKTQELSEEKYNALHMEEEVKRTVDEHCYTNLDTSITINFYLGA